MTVIAMTREMGTRGKDIAAGVADRLGIEVIHHEVVERHLAERLSMTESAVHRFLEGEASLLERWNVDSHRLSRFTSEEILELASRGNVLIRGWGAAQLLRDIDHVICVRVCAPMSDRVSEMQKRLGISDPEITRREIERNDDAHARAVQRQFHVDWQDATGYDVVLNTAHIPIETGVALLQQLAKGGSYEASDESRSMLLDKLIQARVRTMLDAALLDLPIGSSLGVKVRHGQVTIDGVVSSGKAFRHALKNIQSIEGVNSVIDDSISVPMSYGV